MSFFLNYNTSGTALNVTATYTDPYDSISIELTYPDGSGQTIYTANATFAALVTGSYTLFAIAKDNGGNTLDTKSETFTFTATTGSTGGGSTSGGTSGTTTYTVVAPQDFLQAANQPIILTANKSDYSIGQFFYCEVWVTGNKDMHLDSNSISGATQLTVFQKQGEGNGSCSFDIGDTLNSVFNTTNYTAPNPQVRFQKDESSYVQWFVRMGWLYYNAQNVAVKKEEFVSSGNNFAVRAALDSLDSGMGGYCNPYDYSNDTRIQFATRIPYNTKRGVSEPTLLSLFTPIIASSTGRKLRFEADLSFADDTYEYNYLINNYALPTGGLYIMNVKPDVFSNHLKFSQLVSYTVRVAYFDDQAPGLLYFTQDQTFQIKRDIPNPKVVLFNNSLGSWDAIHFRKDFDTKGKPKTSTFRNTYGQRTYNVDLNKVITFQSQYLGIEEYAWLEDLRTACAIYVDNKYYRQLDGDYNSDTSVGLFTYELVVSPENDKNTVRF